MSVCVCVLNELCLLKEKGEALYGFQTLAGHGTSSSCHYRRTLYNKKTFSLFLPSVDEALLIASNAYST